MALKTTPIPIVQKFPLVVENTKSKNVEEIIKQFCNNLKKCKEMKNNQLCFSNFYQTGDFEEGNLFTTTWKCSHNYTYYVTNHDSQLNLYVYIDCMCPHKGE